MPAMRKGLVEECAPLQSSTPIADFTSGPPWSLPPSEAARRLHSDPERGLSDAVAQERLAQYGPNSIDLYRRRSPLAVLASQFLDLMIGLLAVAAVISAFVGDVTDAILIAVIVVANAGIGFIQEWRAEKAVEALRRLTQPHAKVRRDGVIRDIDATEVVPGDLIELSAGDFVPADARLVSGIELEVVEATLTGESLPVEKREEPVPEDTVLPDRTCMLHAGTAVVRGRARALVTATGMSTELGRIAALLESTGTQQTPLQRRLAHLSQRLAAVVIVICIVIFAAGVLRESRQAWNTTFLSRMLLTAVSLAVAAIPEGLPAVITVALALGSRRMASRRAIVRRLAAVETLGSVDVICTDKTGTLTQNRMAAQDFLAASESEDALRRLLEAAVLCNNAEVVQANEAVGSATESALLHAAIERGVDVAALRREWPRLAEIPFNSDRKRMATLHRTPDGRKILFVKGAAERVLLHTARSGDAEAWRQKSDDLAGRGRRVIAVAMREWPDETLPAETESAEVDLQLLGLIGIVDPVRPEARPAIAECHTAGIRVVMITGDHPGTAKAIANEIGLRSEDDDVMTGAELERATDDELHERVPGVSVYARVSPEHKLRIVTAWQSRGSIVAMTGDGVNDAPALRQADIGVAMGITGSDVAKEAGEMILADDNFATIVAAVEEGRIVYDNIRKFVAYLLTTNMGEVLVLFSCIMLGLPLPLLPVHILWINLVTDGLPALALGFQPADPDIMQRPPRPRNESLFAGGLAWAIVLLGILMAAGSVALFWLYLPDEGALQSAADVAYARTLVFVTLSLSQLFHVMAIRSSMPFYRVSLWDNYRLTVAVLLGAVLQFAVVYVPPLQKFFHTLPLTGRDVIISVAVASLVFIAVEVGKQIERRTVRAAA